MSHNRLAAETSPYLLQHVNNPVWWYAWGDAAFAAATAQNKPIFLSVGYATCHWCHVMEGDSFEHQDVADILNQHFISIKVDREERPDVDAIYMSVVQMMTSRGGWPMSVIMTPDRKPFWGGTFVPRQAFKNLLIEVARMWSSDEQDKLLASGQQIVDHLVKASTPELTAVTPIDEQPLKKFYYEMNRSFDEEHAGFGGAPKFPPAMGIMLLLRYYQRHGEENALRMALATLDAMARGGIRDHLGGGFHRYATDEEWLVPHFEKMLYYNALLACAYTEAFVVDGNPEYRDMAKSALDYVLRDLQHPDGGFYSAEDADSEKTEGKFYVWSADELKALLTEREYERVATVYNVSDLGNFSTEARVAELEIAAGLSTIHNVNILFVRPRAALPLAAADEVLTEALRKMAAVRSQRPRPLRDDKVITAWNGLMISAMSRAGAVFGDSQYIDAARGAIAFIKKNLLKEGYLHRTYRAGRAKYRGYAEDYAFLIQGLLDFYEATDDATAQQWAFELQKRQDELFFDKSSGLYFDADTTDQTLLIRPRDVADNATPAANSVTTLNLMRISRMQCDYHPEKVALHLLTIALKDAVRFPRAFPQLLIALDYTNANPWQGNSCPVPIKYLDLLRRSSRG